MNNKTLIAAAIALVAVVLGGMLLFQGSEAVAEAEQEVAAIEIPLKNADLKYLEIQTPENSNFTIKTLLNESNKGMVLWKNTGNYSDEIQSITIDKNLTDQLIHDHMTLIHKNNNTKVYESNGIYQVVKTENDTDIILTGSNLAVLNEMMDSIKIKNTANITSPKPVTPVEKVVDAKKQNDKPVKNVTPTPKPTPQPHEKLYIGGGIIHTGSATSDKTNAKIYIDGGHPGETVIIRIKYYRDGNSLNHGNMVTATIKDDGYVNINSADAYKYFPDKAYIELYDSDGVLQSTQTVTLTPDDSTQYF